jgi:hypothetical protein
MLDYNKIMMELSAVNLEITRKEANIEMVRKLKFMSGSDAHFSDSMNILSCRADLKNL